MTEIQNRDAKGKTISTYRYTYDLSGYILTYKNESGKDFANRILNEKYGEGNYPKGSKSEYNQIRKWGDRGFERKM